MNKQELQQKIDYLEKELSEAIGAIRELSSQNFKNLEIISVLNGDVAELKMAMKRLENSQDATQRDAMYNNSVKRYE